MWIVFALLASILWGLTYVIQEYLFRHIAVTTYLTLISFFTTIFVGIAGIKQKSLFSNLKTISLSKELLAWVFLAITVYIGAELCIAFSIQNKNATLAGLIEISYPLFIAFFALLLFKQDHFTLSTAIGGFLIVSGVAIISLAHR